MIPYDLHFVWKERKGKTKAGRCPEKAYQAALKHAGKKKTQVLLKKNELDFDDGIQKYEIEFVEGFNEYEYDIDATNGMILKYERDFCD